MSGTKAFQNLAACGLLRMTWPSDRVVVGLRVCTWLRDELLHHVDRVRLKLGKTKASSMAALRVGIRSTLTHMRLKRVLLETTPGSGIETDTNEDMEQSNACLCEEHKTHALLDGITEACKAGFGAKLVSLSLPLRRLNAERACQLCEILQHCSELTQLNLEETGIGFGGNEGVGKLAMVLKQCTALTHLDLRGNGVQAEGPLWLVGAIARCTALTHLSLAENELEVSGTAALAEELCVCTRLKFLDLSATGFDSEGATRLAQALRAWTQLTHLNLELNDIENEGAVELATGLRACTAMRTLWLGRNGVGEGGVVALASALCRCSELEELGVSGSRLHGDAAVRLGAVLLSNPKLRKLDLQGCGVGREELQALRGPLGECLQLTCLDL